MMRQMVVNLVCTTGGNGRGSVRIRQLYCAYCVIYTRRLQGSLQPKTDSYLREISIPWLVGRYTIAPGGLSGDSAMDGP